MVSNKEDAVPLLRDSHYENCPGCKVQQDNLLYRGLPTKHLLMLWAIVLATSLPISSLFPFLYFMVRDFHIAKRVEDIGFYAGFVGSSFMFGRMLTAVAWGLFADRYGRKPVIIFGTFIVVIFNTLFGLSGNFWVALIARFLLGSLNGVLGPIKAYACELVREEHQALGLSTITASWGIGLIIGPSIGGFLAQPAEKYPNIFSQDSLFGRFPYLLPCLIISAYAAVVGVACFWIPETLHNHDEENSRSNAAYEKMEAEGRSGDNNIRSIFKNWALMSSIMVYCAFSFHNMAYSEIFSMWAVSPRGLGGLNYTTQDVGEVLSISGLGLLMFQTTLYPVAEKLLGSVMICRVGGILAIPLLACYPLIAKLSGFPLSLMINIASLLKNVIATSVITALFVLQNRAVEQHQRGVANGIALTAMSLFKAIGPAFGGLVFSWSQKRLNASFLPGVELVFFILNVVELIAVLMTFKPFLSRHSF